MQIRFWGVRGSTPAPGPSTVSYGGNTACVSLRNQAGELLIVDAGTGIRALGQALADAAGGEPIAGALLLSHFHWDHIQGIPFFLPFYRASSRFVVYSFTAHGSHFRDHLEGQMQAPYFPVPMSKMGAQCEFREIGEGIFSIGHYRVTTRRLHHPGGALGFRIECDGYSVTYASDHEPDGGRFDANVLELAAGTELLLSDAQYTREEYLVGRVGWGHGTWESAVDLAARAGAKQLLLFHHDPDRSDERLAAIVREARKHFPATRAAAEGMEIHWPEGTEESAVQIHGQQASPPAPTQAESAAARRC